MPPKEFDAPWGMLPEVLPRPEGRLGIYSLRELPPRLRTRPDSAVSWRGVLSKNNNKEGEGEGQLKGRGALVLAR